MKKIQLSQPPYLKSIDLSKAYRSECPGIKTDNKTQYLIKCGKWYRIARFYRVWYGLSSDIGQFNAPGYNGSDIEAIWEIVEDKRKIRKQKLNKIKIMKKFIILIIIALFTISCNGPEKIDKSLFGLDEKETLFLDKGQRLIDVNWRVLDIDYTVQTSIWFLTTDMDSDWIPKTYHYTNGKKELIIIEQK